MLNKLLVSLATVYQFTSAQQPAWVPANPEPLPAQPQPPVVIEPPPQVPVQPQPPQPQQPIDPPPQVPIDPPVAQPALPGKSYDHCKNPSPTAPCQAAGGVQDVTSCANPYDCCLCDQVTAQNLPNFLVGPSALDGVKAVNVIGAPRTGTDIDCFGAESCLRCEIQGTNINRIRAGGALALNRAKVTINNPSPNFQIDCLAAGGCDGAEITLIYPAHAGMAGRACNPQQAQYLQPNVIGKLNCGGVNSCRNLHLTVINEGCNRVEIADFTCLVPGSCTGLSFNFQSAVAIKQCNLRGDPNVENTISGLGDACFKDVAKIDCVTPNSCSYQHKLVVNPQVYPAFRMDCAAVGACEMSRFDFQFTRPYNSATAGRPGGAATHIDGVWCTEQYACAFTSFNFENKQGGNELVIERIECSAPFSCVHAEFITNALVSVNDVECSQPHFCTGCLIKSSPTDPAPVPCYHY